MLARPLRLAPLAISGLVAAGCGGATTIDHTKAEGLIHQAVSASPGAQQPTTVRCPSGVKAAAGATLTCDVVYADGTKGTVTEHITDTKGHVQVGAGDLHLQTSGPASTGAATGK